MITNNDSGATLSIDNVTQTDGDTATTDFTFTFNLSNPTSEPVTVDYTTTECASNSRAFATEYKSALTALAEQSQAR